MSRRNPSPPAPDAASPASDTPATLRTVVIWLTGLTALVIGSWILFGLHMFPRDNAGTGGHHPDGGSVAAKRATRSPSPEAGRGPWGRLRYIPITISPPLELVPQAAPPTSQEIEWHFPDMIPARLPALLSEIGLSGPLLKKLVSLAEVNLEIEGLTVHPTPEIVLGMSPKDRSSLYAVLDAYPGNSCPISAFRFCGNSLDEWIGDSPLSLETRKLIEPLIYRYGSFLFFADLQSIESWLPSPEQRSLLIKALSHESTFMLRLVISDESNLEELIDYWGRGGRTGDVRPILEALHEIDGEQSIDVTHLLPPFARCRLCTYQVHTDGPVSNSRDCHWTAMNFFSEQPDDRFCNVKEVVRTVQEDYFRIYGNLRLGDLVAFFDDQSMLIHTAVFIAADVVFTKNGSVSSHPWMLMKLESMAHYYPSRKRLQTRYFRRKDL